MASTITARKFKDWPDPLAAGPGRRSLAYRRITSALMLQSTAFGIAAGRIFPRPPRYAGRMWISVHGVTRRNFMSPSPEPTTSWEPWPQRHSNYLIKAGRVYIRG